MESLFIDNIGSLVTNDPTLGEGALGMVPAAGERFDAGGGAVLPGFVDSHAHLVFACDRSSEFAARMSGRLYTAGGIRATVATTRDATDAVLRVTLGRLVDEALRSDTTTIECKSGYGLTVADEARSLRLAAKAA